MSVIVTLTLYILGLNATSGTVEKECVSNKNITVKDLILMLDFYDNIVDDNLNNIDINNINGFGSYLFF